MTYSQYISFTMTFHIPYIYLIIMTSFNTPHYHSISFIFQHNLKNFQKLLMVYYNFQQTIITTKLFIHYSTLALASTDIDRPTISMS